MVSSHFALRSLRTQVISYYFVNFVPTFNIHFGCFVPSLVISYLLLYLLKIVFAISHIVFTFSYQSQFVPNLI